MPESKRFERDPAEGSRSTVDKQLKDVSLSPEEDRRPKEEFPPFDDPAFSPRPAQSPAQPAGKVRNDIQLTGHPQNGAYETLADSEARDDVDEKMSGNRNPTRRATPSPGTETPRAGPAVAERSKDVKVPKSAVNPAPTSKSDGR